MISKKKNEAIYINIGSEVYNALDKYRFATGATWKELVLRSLVLSMLTDGYDSKEIDKVTKTFNE